MKVFKYSTLFIILVSITSCFFFGLNPKRKTPKNQGKYPEFTSKDTLFGKLSKFRENFDVSYYNINIEVDIEKKHLNGYVDIHFTAKSNIDTIQIDLHENLSIKKIEYQSEKLSFERKYKAIFVAFGNHIQKDKSVSIRVYYHGKPKKAPEPPWKGGFVWKKDKEKNPFVGVACEHTGASVWWPVKDHLSDEPDSLKINITIPEELFCVSNGRLIEQKKLNGKNIFTWETSYPINTYNVTLYIGNYTHFSIPYKKNDTTYKLDYYVMPYNLEKAKSHFKQVNGIINFFEDKFGEYPWWKDGYKLVESPYQGMEHQTAIAYGSGYKNEKVDSFDYIILHETAHEWWGNSVSVSDFAEIWLHEGFATYSEALYVEHIKGYEEYLNYIYFYSLFIKNKRPLIGPYNVNYWDYNDGDVYTKGALLLHTLRNVIKSDTLFFDILKSFYDQSKYKTATTKEFITLVNRKTGRDLTWFFNQYLNSRVCPQLEYNFVYYTENEEYEINFKWNNVNSDFMLPVEVETGSGKKYILNPSDTIKSIIVNHEEKIFINPRESYISLKRNKKQFNRN